MRKLINAFRVYSDDPVELRTLLLKLRLESDGMDEWIFTENDYTFGSDYKGHVFKTLVASDDRFAPYRDRITILEGSYDCGFKGTEDMQEKRTRAWLSENYLKDLAVPYIMNKYGEDVWVSVADADEMLDFTDLRRAEKIRNILQGDYGHPLFLTMVRYWFDYDNWARGRGYAILPIEMIRSANSISKAYDDYLHEATPMPNPEDLIAFEYSACCTIEHIYRKLLDGPFYYHTMDDLREGFRYNHWPKAKAIGEQIGSPSVNPDNWFETVELTELNSPVYVREHLAELKTHNIDPNYKENRKIHFPQWFK
jgi:hypothetical protein